MSATLNPFDSSVYPAYLLQLQYGGEVFELQIRLSHKSTSDDSEGYVASDSSEYSDSNLSALESLLEGAAAWMAGQSGWTSTSTYLRRIGQSETTLYLGT